MATLLDSLYFSLGWDTKDFDAGRRKIDKGFSDSADSGKKAAGRIEDAGKQAANYFRSLRNETAGLLLAFAGASSVKGFLGDLIDTTAQSGRLSAQLGVSAQALSQWQLVVQEVGGSAQDATNAIQMMAEQIAAPKLGLTTGNEQNLRGFGVTMDTLKGGPSAMLSQIAEGAHGMDPAVASARLRMMGFSPAMITVLLQGRDAVKRMTDAQTENAKKMADAAKSAQEFQKVWADVGIALKTSVLPILTEFLEWINGVIKGGNGINDLKPVIIGAIVAIGIAAASAAGPWALLAGAIVGAYKAYQWWKGETDTSSSMELTPYAEAILKKGSALTPQEAAQYGGAATGAHDGAPVMHPRGTPAVALDGNNPGGINDGDFARRQAGYAGSNGRYAAFRTMQDGVNAQKVLLGSYVRRGYDTPWKIAHKWAPYADGNNSAAYAAGIARQMGIGVNDNIGPAQINSFAGAQGRQENSRFRGARVPVAGGGNAPASQTNHFYIKSTDPKEAGREVVQRLQQRGIMINAASGVSQ